LLNIMAPNCGHSSSDVFTVFVNILCYAGFRMLRRVLLICIFGTLPFTSAHNVTYAALPGVKLCVDPRSVQVTVNVPDAPAGVVETIKSKLEASLRTTLKNYQVPFDEKKECQSDDGFILSGFHIGWLDDGQSPPAFVVVLATQVGKTPAENQSLGAAVVLENLTFDYAYTGILLESDLTRSFEEELPTFNEDTFKDLSTAWWEGNPNGLPTVSHLPQIVGGSMAAFFLLLGGIFLYKQKQEEKRVNDEQAKTDS
jgi:hypothetical protein